jgi:hypothetical protein
MSFCPDKRVVGNHSLHIPLEVDGPDRSYPGTNPGWLRLVHVEEVCHDRLYGGLVLSSGFMVTMPRKILIDPPSQYSTTSWCAVNPVSMKARRFSRIDSRPFHSATPRRHVASSAKHSKPFTEGFVIDLFPEGQQPFWRCGLRDCLCGHLCSPELISICCSLNIVSLGIARNYP